MAELMQTISVDNLRELGQSYLKSNRIADALSIYGQILANHPDDVDALVVLGDAFLVAEDRKTAHALYKRAEHSAPDNKEVKKRISILNLKEDEVLGQELPNISELIITITQKLTGVYREITDKEIKKARALLHDILKNESPAQAVADNLQEIEKLLPALIEINLRQARSEGKPDLVMALENLKGEILQQTAPRRVVNMQAGKVDAKTPEKQLKPKVLMIGPGSIENPFRQALIARGLQRRGFELMIADEKDAWMSCDAFDLLLVQNPHGNGRIIRDMAGFFSCGKPIVLDLSVDFELIPENHPEAEIFGLREMDQRRYYYGAMHLADMITVNNQEFASNLEKSGLASRFMPDAWDHKNELWFEPIKQRRSLNIGLACVPGQVEDVAEIRRAISRVMREFPHTRLVVSGDLQAYQLFDAIGDDRKLFLPPTTVEEYPFMFTHMDMLIMPMRDTYFNQLRSDRRLMEAGIRRIPWLASDLRLVTAWGRGGLAVESTEDWYQHLRNLIVDETLRKQLGDAGYRKAQERRLDKVCAQWEKMFAEIYEQNRNN